MMQAQAGQKSYTVSQSTDVAYMDILAKYAPFYYKRKIISSEKLQDTDFKKEYRYYDSAGFRIDVLLMRCGLCQGSGKSLYGGQICGSCFGLGCTSFITAWNDKTKVLLDRDGHPAGGMAPSTGGSNSNHSGSSGSGRSGSGSVYTKCRLCNGSGVCTSCNGRGTSWKIYGGNDHSACPSCHGNGRCFNCHGTGRI